MKEQNENIDNLFKRLKEDSFEVPASFMEDLNNRLDKEFPQPTKKRRRFFFWFFLGISAFTCAIVGSYLLIDSSENINTSSVVAKNGNTQENALNITTKKTELTEIKNNQPAKNTNKSVLTFNIKTNEVHKKVLDGSSKNNAEANRIYSDSENFINNNIEKQNINREKKGSLKQSKTTKKFFSTKNTDVKARTELSSNTKRDDVQNLNPLIKKTESNGQLTSSSNVEVNDGSDQLNKLKNDTSDYGNLVLSLKKPSLNDLDYGLAEQLPNTNSPTLEEQKPTSKKLWEIDGQIYGGFSQVSMKIKGSDPNYSAIEKQMAFAPTFGFKSNVFYNNINGSLGLEYYQSNEKFKIQTKTLAQTGIDSTFIGIHVDSVYNQIDSIYYYDTTDVYQYNPVYDSVLKDYSIKNKYSWLSIPIAFGYRFKFGKWDVIPRAGVNLNFGIAQNRGDYPGSNGTIQQLDAVKFNADITIQTEVRRNFNNFHVFIAPYYRGNLSPMLKSNPYTISHQSWGINIGAGIKF